MKIMTQDIKFKVRKLLCLLIGSVFLILTTSMNEDTVSSINKCISEADAQCLSSFLNTTIEMNVLGNNGYYGKSQAEAILISFFKENPPRDFSVKQGGSTSANTKFSIGTYNTSKESFRIYYVLKKEGNIEKITKLTIEKR